MAAIVALLALWIAGFCVYVMSIGWRKANWLSRILLILLTLTIVSFANFCVADDLPFELKGGGPDQGYVQDGHYFVGNHSRYVEVSKRFYVNSRRYQHVSFWAFMILLVTTSVGIAVRVRWFANPVPTGSALNNTESNEKDKTKGSNDGETASI